MRTLLLAAVISLIGLSIFAQEAPKKSALPDARRPVLAGEDGNPVQGVRLARAEVKAVIHGSLAQATMTLTFANDQPRVLGGTLTFPLPEGATVTGYGLDVGGQMVDGVAVEKERARLIYEEEIHKRVDPGLVEHVEGNAFRTRLYPIPANGTRSIKIEYVAQIEQQNGAPTLSLPLGFGAELDELSLRIEAPEAVAAPSVKTGGVEGLTFGKTERGFAAVANAKKTKSGDELVIALPELPERSVAVEKRPKIVRTLEELEGPHAIDHLPVAGSFETFEHYFVVTDSPQAPMIKREPFKALRIGVVWDASLSRADVDHAREFKLLELALLRLGYPAADLIVLRNDVEVKPYFAAGGEGCAKLIETIKNLPYDGATNLGGLRLPKNVSALLGRTPPEVSPDYNLFLLFTDGLGNLGADRPARAEAPVFGMCDDLRANHALLRAICEESGGAYYNLKRETDGQAISGIGLPPFSLVSVECKPEEIAEVYPPVGTAVNGRFTVSGRLLVPEATLTLHYGFGQKVISSQTFTISAAGAPEGSLLPRFWAQQKSAALSLFPEKNAQELSRLGRRFNLVTPNTSLLVLETVDQYVQHRVVPPITRPEIYKEFLARIEEHHAQEARTQEQKMQQVAALWNARVQWWEKEYKYPVDLIVKAENRKEDAPRPLAQDAQAANPRLDDRTVASPRQHAMAPASTARPHPVADPEHGAAPGAEPAPLLRRAAALGGGRGGSPDALVVLDGRLEREADGKSGKGMKDSGVSNDIAVMIKPWDPKTPYIAALKAVPPEKAYDVYLAQRSSYARSPAFYFDCADYLVDAGQRNLGIRVLTDIVELELHDARLLRVAAHRLNQIGERELAIDLFEKVLKLRPEEPQSYRDLALALADRADAAVYLAWVAADNALPPQQTIDRVISDYTRSLELLNKVVQGNWPRFPEVELPVLMEANDIAAKAQRLPGVHDFHNPIDDRLQKNLDCDVRVVMTWDADQTDIDLWVTEPSGEKCFYAHNRTVIGGLLSHDFTDGYGPEEYCLRKLMPGKYAIQANYFGSRQQELTGPATVQATVITNFGRPNEKRQAMTLRLKDVKQVVDVGSVTLGVPPAPAPKPQ